MKQLLNFLLLMAACCPAQTAKPTNSSPKSKAPASCGNYIEESDTWKLVGGGPMTPRWAYGTILGWNTFSGICSYPQTGIDGCFGSPYYQVSRRHDRHDDLALPHHRETRWWRNGCGV